jgi:formylglycine-generating enzyme required for sulfatase activity
VHGNVWEWTENCWSDSNNGNPGYGRARSTADCSGRIVRVLVRRCLPLQEECRDGLLADKRQIVLRRYKEDPEEEKQADRRYPHAR